MIRYCKSIALFACSMLFFSHTGKAQPVSPTDSLIFHLGEIKNATDTNEINKAITWLYKTPEVVLLKDDVLNAINQLKATLGDRDYYDLSYNYFASLIRLNTAAANAKVLSAAQNWLLQNENTPSKFGRYTYLAVMRELRHPFRNSGNLGGAVEYFGTAEKKFLAANDSAGISLATNVLSGTYFRLGMMERGKYYQLKSIDFLNDKQEDYSFHPAALLYGKAGKANRFSVLGAYYVDERKPEVAVGFLNEAIRHYQQLDSPLLMTDAPYLFLQMARCKTLEKNDSSHFFYETARKYMATYKSPPLAYASYYQEKSADFISKEQLDSAMNNINRAIQLKDSFNLPVTSYLGELLPAYYKGTILLKKNRAPEAISLLQAEIGKVRQLNLKRTLIKELVLLAKVYTAGGNTVEAYKTLEEAFTIKEEIVNSDNDARSLGFETEKKMQESEKTILLLDAQNKSNQKIKIYLIGIVLLLCLLAIGLSIFYRNKRKTNRELSLKEKLSYTLDKLQATQSQLVQAEKMASLGELTAGIAHEIQNPLNFVNNFSEVSSELIDEMNDELARGNTKAAMEIAADVKQNLEKVLHHGKRADGIVKGMLQHSRSSNGIKEPTDINLLCDEYVRLAYHGLRAKDKSFNAEFKTELDDRVGLIPVVPQDIGRVVLNLINNAFYAADEKKTLRQAQDHKYVPAVSVSTKKINGKVEIKVSDNGNGIPQKVLDKIFQPFFTTKPAGQGTGLGLSLSYDIVKAHGGDIKVDTEEGKGTTFIIELPAGN